MRNALSLIALLLVACMNPASIMHGDAGCRQCACS